VQHDDVLLPGGHFAMGDSFDEGLPGDGEGPVHEVELSPFRIDRTCVTNEQFATFVAETGYVTEAEKFGNSSVFAPAVLAGTSDVIGTAGSAWWLIVRGACWRHPFGPQSDLTDMADHPAVHLSHSDALAYCGWSGRALPTEAEWEYAARGGLAGRRFPWGDELEQDGQHHANVWQGTFPQYNSAADGWLATAPVRTYEPNTYGLYQMVGNVWEWCADWFGPSYYRTSQSRDPQGPETGQARVVRGGSYLCHHSYCRRYRVAARSANTPNSSTGNLGFRTVFRHLAPAA
jgi:formylglycine-generating enzyme required for sulfatase activity